MDGLLCLFYFHTAQRIRIEDLVDMQSTIYVKSYYQRGRGNKHPELFELFSSQHLINNSDLINLIMKSHICMFDRHLGCRLIVQLTKNCFG